MTETSSVHTAEQVLQSLKEKIRPGLPSFFDVRTQLPSVGRSDVPLAATENMTVIVKAYAQGGENGLHAHVDEDHVFIVLQGQATFNGPKGELKIADAYGGVMLPKGTLYSFESTGKVPLVLLRVGSGNSVTAAINRIGADGLPQPPESKENKQVAPLLSSAWFPAVAA